MNNINNCIYNNNQNNKKLNDNEMQEQLTELDYMRKKINIYQERIKTLEELIKQKDFEIENLKYRLSSNFCFNQNMQPINYNPILMMEQMNNFKYKIDNINQIKNNNNTSSEKSNDRVENLTLTFRYGETQIQVQCQSNEKMQSAINRFCIKAAVKPDSYKFIFNAKAVINNLTIKENGLSNNCNIFVIDTKKKNLADNKKEETQMKNNPEIPLCYPTIQLSFNCRGTRLICIPVSKNTRFSEAISKFLMKMGILEQINHLFFLYNSIKLNVDDDRTIEEIFGKNKNDIEIVVIDPFEVKGA